MADEPSDLLKETLRLINSSPDFNQFSEQELEAWNDMMHSSNPGDDQPILDERFSQLFDELQDHDAVWAALKKEAESNPILKEEIQEREEEFAAREGTGFTPHVDPLEEKLGEILHDLDGVMKLAEDGARISPRALELMAHLAEDSALSLVESLEGRAKRSPRIPIGNGLADADAELLHNVDKKRDEARWVRKPIRYLLTCLQRRARKGDAIASEELLQLASLTKTETPLDGEVRRNAEGDSEPIIQSSGLLPADPSRAITLPEIFDRMSGLRELAQTGNETATHALVKAVRGGIAQIRSLQASGEVGRAMLSKVARSSANWPVLLTRINSKGVPASLRPFVNQLDAVGLGDDWEFTGEFNSYTPLLEALKYWRDLLREEDEPLKVCSTFEIPPSLATLPNFSQETVDVWAESGVDWVMAKVDATKGQDYAVLRHSSFEIEIFMSLEATRLKQRDRLSIGRMGDRAGLKRGIRQAMDSELRRLQKKP